MRDSLLSESELVLAGWHPLIASTASLIGVLPALDSYGDQCVVIGKIGVYLLPADKGPVLRFYALPPRERITPQAAWPWMGHHKRIDSSPRETTPLRTAALMRNGARRLSTAGLQ